MLRSLHRRREAVSGRQGGAEVLYCLHLRREPFRRRKPGDNVRRHFHRGGEGLGRAHGGDDRDRPSGIAPDGVGVPLADVYGDRHARDGVQSLGERLRDLDCFRLEIDGKFREAISPLKHQLIPTSIAASAIVGIYPFLISTDSTRALIYTGSPDEEAE